VTDGNGLPVGLAVAGANRNDFKMARSTLESLAIPRPAPTPESPQGLCLDKGYDYAEVRALAEEFGFTAHSRCRGEEAKAIKQDAGFKARRWVVERTHSWMNRFRRILVRWEQRADTYLAMLHLTLGLICWRTARSLKRTKSPFPVGAEWSGCGAVLGVAASRP
jgi:transposase